MSTHAPVLRGSAVIRARYPIPPDESPRPAPREVPPLDRLLHHAELCQQTLLKVAAGDAHRLQPLDGTQDRQGLCFRVLVATLDLCVMDDFGVLRAQVAITLVEIANDGVG